MRSHIVRVGNSLGIRIPKTMLEETGLVDEVVLTVAGRSLVISPVRTPRDGWDAAFAGAAVEGTAMAAAATGLPADVVSAPDEPALTDVIEHSFDDGEWEWK